MLTPTLENKLMPSGGSETVLDFGGTPVTREHLKRVQDKLIEQLAIATDPSEIEDLALNLARVNSSMAAFDGISQAKQQAADERDRMMQRQLAEADRDRKLHTQNCADISVAAIKRSTGHEPTLCTDPDQDYWYKAVRCKYVAKLFEALSLAAAADQAAEIYIAERERREWKELVTLPKVDIPPVDKANYSFAVGKNGRQEVWGKPRGFEKLEKLYGSNTCSVPIDA